MARRSSRVQIRRRRFTPPATRTTTPSATTWPWWVRRSPPLPLNHRALVCTVTVLLAHRPCGRRQPCSHPPVTKSIRRLSRRLVDMFIACVIAFHYVLFTTLPRPLVWSEPLALLEPYRSLWSLHWFHFSGSSSSFVFAVAANHLIPSLADHAARPNVRWNGALIQLRLSCFSHPAGLELGSTFCILFHSSFSSYFPDSSIICNCRVH